MSRSSTVPPAPRSTRSLGNRSVPAVSLAERSLPAPTSQQPVADRTPPEDEPELDLDIARAYCELTEGECAIGSGDLIGGSFWVVDKD